MHRALTGLRRWPVVLVALLVLGVASVGSLAAVSASSTISTCVKKKGGSIRIVSARARCRRGEKALSWNAIGPAGPRGLRGFTGAKGPTGATGSAGSNGAANGFVDTNPTVGAHLTLPGTASVVATLKLPSGRYVVQGDVHVTAVSTGTKVTCSLNGNEEKLDESAISVGTEKAGQVEQGDLALGGGLTLTAPGMAWVSCTPAAGGNSAAAAKITATQVTNLTSTTG